MTEGKGAAVDVEFFLWNVQLLIDGQNLACEGFVDLIEIDIRGFQFAGFEQFRYRQCRTHSENGFVGMGPPLADGTPDHHVVDAGGRAVTLRPGAACFDSVLSFGLVRGQHLDLAVLGAFQVAINGDLANWKIPGKLTPGMGGAMELAQKARKVVVLSRHSDKLGRAKLVAQCDLPLTAAGCVDTLVTERAVFRRRGDRLQLSSVPPPETVDSVLQSIDAEIAVDSPLEPWDQEGR